MALFPGNETPDAEVKIMIDSQIITGLVSNYSIVMATHADSRAIRQREQQIAKDAARKPPKMTSRIRH